MIVISSVAKSFGPQTLFEGVTLQLNRGARYGLVGANGSGKSTFLEMLMGDEPTSEGDITIPRGTRVGVLGQDQFALDEQRIIDVAMQGDERVWPALAERERLLERGDVDAHRLAELDETIAMNDGYTLQARSAAVLTGLGVPDEQLEQTMRVLSGGFRLRVLLGKVLVGNPDVLLLDEPTNHLDILSIRWLEQFLCGYEGCAVVISHDHRFLERVSTHVLDVDYRTITAYTGSYQSFLDQKQLFRSQKEAEIARLEKLVADKMAFIERFRAKASKARQAQSRVKQVEKIEVPPLVPSSRRAPLFRFEQQRPSGREVLEVKGITKSFGERRVLTDVDLVVRRGERVAVIGANGLGKSTLLKVLTGRLEPDRGTVNWGHEAHLGYFAQDHRETLTNPDETPLDYVWKVCPSEGTSFVRGQLGRMLFTGDEVTKPVTALSGGESARLIFCRMMIEKPNVLLLDEPTNHLDLEGIEALVAGLKAFEGTLVFVSHDRWFVSELATRVIDLRRDGIFDFKGTFDEYLARSGEDHLDAEAVRSRAQQEKRAEKSEQASEQSWEERKRRQNRIKALPQKRDRLLERIGALEEELRAIRAQYGEPAFFDPANAQAATRSRAREAELQQSIETLTAEWELVEEELAAAEG